MGKAAPVLLIIFNRPRETERVFDAIRQSRPSRLYVASDGPRENNPEDRINVLAARSIASRIDWPCEVRTLYRESNLGCKSAVESALTWFFENEEEGVILEDDCLPSPDFFVFCNELLHRYRQDERVWVITGNNFQEGKKRGDAFYYFSSYPHCWGWATWRRRWIKHDPDLANWHEIPESPAMYQVLPKREVRSYWRKLFLELSKSNNTPTWDYSWTATVWRNSGLTATPNENLVSNIGFGDNSTHTKDVNSPLSFIPTRTLGPIHHPQAIVRDSTADEYTFKKVFQGSVADVAISKILAVPVLGQLARLLGKSVRRAMTNRLAN